MCSSHDCTAVIMCDVGGELGLWFLGVVSSCALSWYILSRVDYSVTNVSFWLASWPLLRGPGGQRAAPWLASLVQLMVWLPLGLCAWMAYDVYSILFYYYRARRAAVIGGYAVAGVLVSMFTMVFAYSLFRRWNWMPTPRVKLSATVSLAAYAAVYAAQNTVLYYNTANLGTLPWHEFEAKFVQINCTFGGMPSPSGCNASWSGNAPGMTCKDAESLCPTCTNTTLYYDITPNGTAGQEVYNCFATPQSDGSFGGDTDNVSYAYKEHINLQSHAYVGGFSFFLVLNLVPTIIVTYLQADTALPVAFTRFLRDPRKLDPLGYRVRIANADDDRVNGTYYPSRTVKFDGVPVYVKRRRPPKLAPLVGEASKAQGEAASPTARGNASDDDSDPPDGAVLRRVRVFETREAFWVCTVDDEALYAMRSSLMGPPSGEWHVVNPEDEDVLGTRPVVVAENLVIHEYDDDAKLTARAERRRRFNVIALMYLISCGSLVCLSAWAYTNEAFKCHRWNRLGILVSFVLLWAEVAQLMRLFAKVKMSPLTATLINCFARILLVLAEVRHIYPVACVLFVVYSVPVAAAVANHHYPDKTAEQVLHDELKHLLPKWMYSVSGHTETAEAVDSSAVSTRLLSSLFVNPLGLRVVCQCDRLKRKVFGPTETARTRVRARRTYGIQGGSGRRKKGWSVAMTALLYLSTTFCIGIYAAYHYRTLAEESKNKSSATFPNVSIHGIIHCLHAWKLGVATVTFVWVLMAALLYLRAFRYYGHRPNKLPVAPVLRLGAIALALAWLSSTLLFVIVNYDRPEPPYWILIGGCTISTIVIVGHWTFRNWETNDYLCLRTRAYVVSSDRRSRRINWVPNCGGRQLRRDSGVIIGFVVIEALWATFTTLVASAGERLDTSSSWALFISINLVQFTLLALKEWFSTMRAPLYPGFFAAGFFVAGCYLVLTDSELKKKIEAQERLVANCLFGYPVVVVLLSAVYQWIDSGGELSRRRTPCMFWLLVALIVVVLVLMGVVAGFVNSQPATATFTKEHKASLEVVIVAGSLLFAWMMTMAMVWATRKFRLPRRLKQVTAALAVIFISLLVWMSSVWGLGADNVVNLTVSMIVASLLFLAISELRPPSTRILRHFHSKALFPVESLNSVSGAMRQRNDGAFSLLAAGLVMVWWGIFAALLASEDDKRYMSSAAACLGVVGSVTFWQHKRHMGRERYYRAWERMRLFPEQLFALRDATLEADGLDSSAPTDTATIEEAVEAATAAMSSASSGGGGGGGGGGGASGGGAGEDEVKPADAGNADVGTGGGDGASAVAGDSTSGGAAASQRSTSVAEAAAEAEVPIAELTQLEVPTAYPGVSPFTSLWRSLSRGARKCAQAGTSLFGSSGDGFADFPTHYLVTSGCPLVTGAYVRHGTSDGVPQYVQFGKALTMYLKRIQFAGGRFWVIAQPNKMLYGVRVEGAEPHAELSGPSGVAFMATAALARMRNAVTSPKSDSAERKAEASKPLLAEDHLGDVPDGPGAGAAADARPLAPKGVNVPPLVGWIAIGDYDDDTDQGLLVQEPVLRTWASIVESERAVRSYRHTLSSMYRQECRREARFCMMLELAAEEQHVREQRVIWTFVRHCVSRTVSQVGRPLHDTSAMMAAATGTTARAGFAGAGSPYGATGDAELDALLSEGMAGPPSAGGGRRNGRGARAPASRGRSQTTTAMTGSGGFGGLGGLAPYEVEQWVRRHSKTAELPAEARKFARAEHERRMRQRRARELEQLRSLQRRAQAVARPWRFQFRAEAELAPSMAALDGAGDDYDGARQGQSAQTRYEKARRLDEHFKRLVSREIADAIKEQAADDDAASSAGAATVRGRTGSDAASVSSRATRRGRRQAATAATRLYQDPMRPRLGAAKFVPSRDLVFGDAAVSGGGAPWQHAGRLSLWGEREEPQAADIEQGAVGDCWLLSAMGVLAEKMSQVTSHSMARDVILGYDANKGYYVVKLYRAEDAQWVWVVVDDYFPADTDNTPIAAHSSKPVLWVSVLEKAMAKFYGAGGAAALGRPAEYDVLDSGLVHDALVAFTGGASQEIDLHDSASMVSVTVLWQKLKQYAARGYLVGCTSPSGDDSAASAVRGIVQGHAFSVLDLRQVSVLGKKYRMIKLRNPWGDNPVPQQGETPLDWMPGSPMWLGRGGAYMQQKLGYAVDPMDGAEDDGSDGSGAGVHDRGVFWLTFEDCVANFATISVCRVLDGGSWESRTLDGAWEHGCMGGLVTGSTGWWNPQYRVTVTRTTSLFVTLTQSAIEGRERLPHIQCVVFASDGRPLTHALSAEAVHSKAFWKSGPARDQREVSIDIERIHAGTYTIVPFTYWSDIPGSFKLRVHFPRTSEAAAAAVAAASTAAAAPTAAAPTAPAPDADAALRARGGKRGAPPKAPRQAGLVSVEQIYPMDAEQTVEGYSSGEGSDVEAGGGRRRHDAPPRQSSSSFLEIAGPA